VPAISTCCGCCSEPSCRKSGGGADAGSALILAFVPLPRFGGWHRGGIVRASASSASRRARRHC
jgi:hypothetical protein